MIMESPKITKEEIDIIKKAQAGSVPAFNQLYYKYKAFVESLMKSLIKDEDEAKDIANLVFVKMYDKLSKFKAYDSFGGWLRILAKNTAIDYLRTVKDKQIYVDPTDFRLNQVESNIQEECDLVNQMTFDDILKMLKDMPPLKKKVCEMYYSGGNTIAEINKKLNVPTGTIKSILFRFRKKVFNSNIL